MKDLLREAAMLRELSDEALGRVMESGSLREVVKGSVIFVENEPGSDFFILLSGKVRLSKSTVEGREVTLKIISPPEAFAEVILFENERYPVTAEAIEDSRIFVLSRRAFYGLLDSRGFRGEFVTMLMKKQRYLAERILYLTSYDVEDRFLMFLAEHYGKKGAYHIDMSKKDIASAIGTIPETFSRLLQRLRKRGVLEWEGDMLKLGEGFWEKSELDI